MSEPRNNVVIWYQLGQKLVYRNAPRGRISFGATWVRFFAEDGRTEELRVLLARVYQVEFEA